VHSLRDINEYLFYEFGRDLDEDETAISDDHPFELVPAGEFRDSRGETSFPSVNERRARTESMLTGANLDPSVWRIRLGLFLTATSRYLALAEKEDGTAFVVGAADDPVPARFPGASPWRRLAHTLGRLIEAGELSDPS
jgi:hypothetical protein